MKANLNVVLALLLGLGLGILIMRTMQRKDQVKIEITAADESRIKSIFSSGCEIGIMKYCEVKKQEECRRYCLLFLEGNPDVLELLKQGISR